MEIDRTIAAAGVSIATGITWYFGFRALTGADDPQSTDIYWRLGYPLHIVMSFALGWLAHEMPWRWPLLMVASQLVFAIAIPSTSDMNQLLLGVVLHVFLVIPGAIAAHVGAWVSRRVGG